MLHLVERLQDFHPNGSSGIAFPILHRSSDDRLSFILSIDPEDPDAPTSKGDVKHSTWGFPVFSTLSNSRWNLGCLSDNVTRSFRDVLKDLTHERRHAPFTSILVEKVRSNSIAACDGLRGVTPFFTAPFASMRLMPLSIHQYMRSRSSFLPP
jgi:hypothetical protein